MAKGFTFRPAKRENLPLLIALAGGPGSGKTYSALELATGLVAGTGKKIRLLDTESRRALFYADVFDFEHADLAPPHGPDRYLEAILAADQKDTGCIIVDSGSHEWAGEGGILELHEAELQRLTRGDERARDKYKFLAWVKPKAGHKKLVYRMLALRSHLIFCFRAEDKIELKGEKKRIQEVKTQWLPVVEKHFLFEMHVALLLAGEGSNQEGIPSAPYRPFKLPSWARGMISLDKRISRDSGKMLAAWASGAQAAGVPGRPRPTSPASDPTEPVFVHVVARQRDGWRVQLSDGTVAYTRNEDVATDAGMAKAGGVPVQTVTVERGKALELMVIRPQERPGRPEKPSEPDTARGPSERENATQEPTSAAEDGS